jgi:hypothetical protein
MTLEPDRVYHMSELKILLEKQRKEKEQKDQETQTASVVNKTHLEDKDISEKNCAYLSGDIKNVINILNRKIMYRNGQLWCPDHGDKCIIKEIQKDSYFPTYTCSLQPIQASYFGMGCGKVIKNGKRTPLFFYNFNSDIRKIIVVAALLQFEQLIAKNIVKFGEDISYSNCTSIKEALTRAQVHDVRALQILQNQWNLYKRYCAFHNLNHLRHLIDLIKETPFLKMRNVKKRAETAQTMIFNPPREVRIPSFVQSVQPVVIQQIPTDISVISPGMNLSYGQQLNDLVQAIEASFVTKYKDMESYKEDALKYRRMMSAING